MDEPLGALDPITRQQVRREFRHIESLASKTNVLVTHDIAEAVELGDRICLMSEGRIEQIGTAAELLFRPRTEFVRSFFDGARLQTEWLAVTLDELPLAESDRTAAGPYGLPGSATVAGALGQLEKSDEAAFGRVISAFFDYKRALAAAGAGDSR